MKPKNKHKYLIEKLEKIKFKDINQKYLYFLNFIIKYIILYFYFIGLTDEDFKKGAVGLSHNYYRHK